MCGFACIVDQEQSFDPFLVLTMVEQISYRGPDGSGHKYYQEGVSFAHKRLSIIDTAASGNQPMLNIDEQYCIVFNGEIYNYLEIKEELLQKEYFFRTKTDTEVLLNAYICWGKKCLERLIGMFAFAIWDCKERSLFAARDRMGIKPLYYYQKGSRLYLASEIKSILSVLSEKPGPDETLIDAYMDFGYVPGGNTLHKGIKKLLPAHSLQYSLDRVVSVEDYWTSDFSNMESLSFDEYCKDLNHIFEDSVRLRLRSDVPLGVFLSGGLDSSGVVSYLAPEAREGLNTFSVAYDYGPKYDETSFARQVAKTFGTSHHELRVSPTEFSKFIPQYVWLMDEPVTEAAAISLYYVSKLAREHVVVALSGEGADELFAGYDFYIYNIILERIRALLGGSYVYAFLSVGQKLLPNRKKINKYLKLTAQPLHNRYKGVSSSDPSNKLDLYTKDFLQIAAHSNEDLEAFLNAHWDKSKDWDVLSRMLYFDQKTWLVDDLLIKADRMSMANSIELRVPFLDHRLVEYANKIPSDFKISKRDTKYILKKLLNTRLPSGIINRKKMGFPTPLEHMLRKELFKYAQDLLLSQDTAISRYFSRDSIERLLEAQRTGKGKHHSEIWQLVILEQWHITFGYQV